MGRINEGTLSQLPVGHPWARCTPASSPQQGLRARNG